MADSRYTSHLDHVKVMIAEATQKVLAQAAFQIEAETKVNIQKDGLIDTGFMLNSVYAVTRESSGYGEARGAAMSRTVSRKTGRTVDHSRDMAPEVTLPAKDNSKMAAVVVGASYAIFQEVENLFLFAAAEKVGGQFGGTAEQVYAREFHD